jgi:hypothetical protein
MSNIKSGSAPRAVSTTIINAATCSLKRLAWAYGCAPKGSDEERQLEQILVARIATCDECHALIACRCLGV